jgi:hypothetical protein
VWKVLLRLVLWPLAGKGEFPGHWAFSFEQRATMSALGPQARHSLGTTTCMWLGLNINLFHFLLSTMTVLQSQSLFYHYIVNTVYSTLFNESRK